MLFRSIRITKINTSLNPSFPSQPIEEHTPGILNLGFSLPVEYYVEGTMDDPPVVGKPFTMVRTNRNGIEASGVFATSRVVKITEDGFETMNSIYKIEHIE